MKYLRNNPQLQALGWSGMVDELIISNILNSMSDSLLVIDAQGNVVYSNKATRDILGFSLEEFREKGLTELLSGNHENRDFNQVFSDVIWNKCTNDYKEVAYRHPDGEVRRLGATTSYLLADRECESVLVGFVLVFKDVTELFNLRRKEQELRDEKQRIAHEKVKSLHRLAMGVAHEIRNPVVTIGGFAARIMRNQNNPEETRDHASKILGDARKLERLVDDVQRFCDLPELKGERGDFTSTLKHAVAAMVPKALDRNIQLIVRNMASEHHCVYAADLITRALGELLDNAIDFSEDGSTVLVSLFRTGRCTVLEVTDSGAGIDPRDLDYIFDPFFSTRIYGSGMGLSIVERIVHEHLGRIEVESELGGGSTFRIVLTDCLV
jgi:PAS domain S-box-containing protein